MTLPLLLTSCLYAEPAEGDTVVWSGFVLASLLEGESGLEEGSLSWVSEEGLLLGEGEQPEPGVWQVELEPGLPCVVDISQDASPWRARFAGVTPAHRAYWFTGTFFGYTELEEELLAGMSAGSLSEDRADLWIAVDGSAVEDEALLSLTLTGGDGLPHPLQGWRLSELGELSPADQPPIHYLTAHDIEPGEVTLTGSDWTRVFPDTRRGDRLLPWYVIP